MVLPHIDIDSAMAASQNSKQGLHFAMQYLTNVSFNDLAIVS
jgi:hypothetical protein